MKVGEPFRLSGRVNDDVSLRCVSAEEHIDIVQNFHVIADEADRRDDYFVHTLRRVSVEARFHGGAQPCAAAHPLTLVSEVPIGEAQARRHRRRRGARFAIVLFVGRPADCAP